MNNKVKKYRTILHCDCNSFFASVESVFKPELKNVPMAVCGDPNLRHGIILAKNELAKQYNIKTAETIWQAKQKCPDLVLVEGHYDRYVEFSKAINQIYLDYTDLVEPFSIDESWLDVSGSKMLFGSGREIADTLRERVKNELGISISVGVSFNKVFAKMGSDYKKPDATTVILPHNYKEILYPLPISDLLFVGRHTYDSLSSASIRTIGDLAECRLEFLSARLGKQGETLYNYVHGLDDSPVKHFDDVREVKSVGKGMTYARNLQGVADVRSALLDLTDQIATTLRKNCLKAQTVTVQIKDPSFKVISRQKPLEFPSYVSNDIFNLAFKIMKDNWDLAYPIRAITVTANNLTSENIYEQTTLFSSHSDKNEKMEKLSVAMDNVRKKYGKSSVSYGRLLKNELFSTSIEEKDSKN